MTNSDSFLVKLVGFDIALVEKWKNSKIKTLIFLLICFQSVESWKIKLYIRKKIDVTQHPSMLKLMQRKCNSHQPVMCLDFFSCKCQHACAWCSMAL